MLNDDLKNLKSQIDDLEKKTVKKMFSNTMVYQLVLSSP